MKENARTHAGRLLGTIVVTVSILSFIAGCEDKAGPTGPIDPSTTPSVAGHWVGSGKHFGTLNFTMVADFADVQQWNSNFVGTMSTTWPSMGQTNHMYAKGTVSKSRLVSITDTGGVAMFGTPVVTVPVESTLYSTRTACVLSANGDTISYSGPSGIGPETFVLIKQK
jgi:hypothetical protein